eukprot:1167005-Pleurochrysis_carterae.AAC.2
MLFVFVVVCRCLYLLPLRCAPVRTTQAPRAPEAVTATVPVTYVAPRYVPRVRASTGCERAEPRAFARPTRVVAAALRAERRQARGNPVGRLLQAVPSALPRARRVPAPDARTPLRRVARQAARGARAGLPHLALFRLAARFPRVAAAQGV